MTLLKRFFFTGKKLGIFKMRFHISTVMCIHPLREEHRLRVFENGELSRMFGPKGEEVTGGWRTLHNEELCNLHTSSNIRVIKSRRMVSGACSIHEAIRMHTKFWSENLMGRDHSEDVGIDEKVILEWILAK
jgi:hypothetical protein